MKTALLIIVSMLLAMAAGCNGKSAGSPAPQVPAATTTTLTQWTHPPKDPEKITVYPATPEQMLPYFPVEKEPAKAYFLTILKGKLIIDTSGRIRIETTDSAPALVIWPYGYSFTITEDAQMWIADEEGQPVWKIGDTVTLGGGYAEADIAQLRIGQALPAGCKGPYFLAAPR